MYMPVAQCIGLVWFNLSQCILNRIILLLVVKWQPSLIWQNHTDVTWQGHFVCQKHTDFVWQLPHIWWKHMLRDDCPLSEGNSQTWRDDCPLTDGNSPTWRDDCPLFDGNSPTWRDNSPLFDGNSPMRRDNRALSDCVMDPSGSGCSRRHVTALWAAESIQALVGISPT